MVRFCASGRQETDAAMEGVKANAEGLSHLCMCQSCVPMNCQNVRFRDPTHVMECDTGMYHMCTSVHLQRVWKPGTLGLNGANRGLKARRWHVVLGAPAGLFLPPASTPGPSGAWLLSASRTSIPAMSPTSLPPQAVSFLPDCNGIF